MKKTKESNLNDLLEKDKKELKKLKLALEVNNFEENLEFERKKYRENLERDKKRSSSEFFRLLLVLIVGSSITLAGNFFLESIKIQGNIKVVEEEANETKMAMAIKQLHNYKNQIPGADLNKQIGIFCIIGEMDNTLKVSELTKAIKIYRKKCLQAASNRLKGEEKAMKADSLISSIDKNDAAEYEANEDNIASLKIKEAKGALSSQEKKNLKKAVDNRDNILKSNLDLRELVGTTEAIEIIQVSQIKDAALDINDSYQGQKIIMTHDDWFKEGYYLQFGVVRITLEKLFKNDQMIRITLRDTKNSQESCEYIEETKKMLRYNQPLILKSCSRDYMISLKRIGKAGKNPFNLAAYISMVELSK